MGDDTLRDVGQDLRGIFDVQANWLRGSSAEGRRAIAAEKTTHPPPRSPDEARVGDLIRQHTLADKMNEVVRRRLGLGSAHERPEKDLDAFLASLPPDRRKTAADYGMKIAALSTQYSEYPAFGKEELNSIPYKMRVLAKHGGSPDIAVLTAVDYYIANRHEVRVFSPEEQRRWDNWPIRTEQDRLDRDKAIRPSVSTGEFVGAKEPLQRSIELFSGKISKAAAQQVVDRIGGNALSSITMTHLWKAGATSANQLTQSMLLDRKPGFPLLRTMLEQGARPGRENLFYEFAKASYNGSGFVSRDLTTDRFRDLKDLGFDINGPADQQGHNALARLIQEAEPRDLINMRNGGLFRMLVEAGASWDQRGKDGLSARDIYTKKIDAYTADLDRGHAATKAALQEVPGDPSAETGRKMPAGRAAQPKQGPSM